MDRLERWGLADNAGLAEAVEGQIEFIAYRGDQGELPAVLQEENAAGFFILNKEAAGN